MLSACLIVRDEASTLAECLETVRPYVDEVVIVDTGSVDGTPEIARKYADKFETFLDCNDTNGLIQDFALARNRSWELASGEWAMWIDGDDILDGGENLLKLIDNAPKRDNVVYMAPYEYEYDPSGNVVVLHHRERIMCPRHRFQWQCPVHEGCLPIQPVEGSIETLMAPGIVFKHQLHKSAKPREPRRNLRILQGYVQRMEEGDPRAMFYLGLEHHLHGEIGPALNLLTRYVEIANWCDEKCLALLEIARIYQRIGHHTQAKEWALEAITTKSWPSPYWSLGRTFYAMAIEGPPSQKDYNFNRANSMFEQGLILAEKAGETTLMQNPRERYEIHEYLNAGLAAVGKIEKALWSCEQGLQAFPKHEGMLQNRELYRRELAKHNIRVAIDVLKEAGDEELARSVEAGLGGAAIAGPAPVASNRVWQDERPAPTGDKLDIALFVGRQLEPWTPETLAATGLGGSETMAWGVAKRLAKRGHRVRLFGHCTHTQEQVYEGVEWYDEGRFRDVDCDALISSRRPDAVDDHWNCRAHAKFLWVHDIHCGPGFDLERSQRFDEVWTLSHWHKDFFASVYPSLDKSKLVQIRNGIDLELWHGKPEPKGKFLFVGAENERNPHKAVYSSSPDRGLQTALDCWPKVREQVPDAELHIYYGFENWEKSCRLSGDDDSLKSIAYLRKLIDQTEGVVFHGRVPEAELAREYFSAGVWAYPTWFLETSCIGAMQAQAAGLYMVTSPIAALNETAGDRAYMCHYEHDRHDYWRTAEYMEEWTGAVVDAMMPQDGVAVDEFGRIHRSGLQQYARDNFGLDSLVDDLERRIRARIDQNVEAVVPPFVDFKDTDPPPPADPKDALVQSGAPANDWNVRVVEVFRAVEDEYGNVALGYGDGPHAPMASGTMVVEVDDV